MSSKCHLTTPAKAQEDTAHLDWSHGQVSKVNLSIKSPGIFFSTTVGDLGVIQDNELTLSENMRNVCHTCFYHLRQIRSVRRSLTTKAAYPDACIHLHKSRVLQRYLCGLNRIVIIQLYSVLNAAAHLIGGIPMFQHMSGFIGKELR